jgi:hypothetical protein
LIPADFITEWREQAPWVQASQVEQDLIISRALVEIFGDDELARALAFRGGTAATTERWLAEAARIGSDGLPNLRREAWSAEAVEPSYR